VFECVRRRQRETNWHHLAALQGSIRRSPPEVSRTHGGWLLGEADKDSDGLRALGALRTELREVVRAAPIGRRRRLVLSLWFGLDAAPLGMGDSDGAIGGVIGLEVNSDGRPLTDRTLVRLRRSALTRVASYVEARPTEDDVRYGPVPDPRKSPWFARLIPEDRRSTWAQAIDAALELAAVGDPSSPRRLRLTAEVARVASVALVDSDLSGRRQLQRALALVSVAAWDVIADQSHLRNGWRSTAPALLALAPATARPRAASPDDIRLLLAGVRQADPASTEVDAALRRCLAVLDARWLPADLEAEILAQAAWALRLREDWGAIALVRRLLERFPTNPRTLDACMDAVMVAGPYNRFDIAESVLTQAERLAPGIGSRGRASPGIERIEYLHALRYARSALVRRRLEAMMLIPGGRPSAVYGMIESRAAREHGQVLAGDAIRVVVDIDTRTWGGDGELSWVARAQLRHAEFLQLASLAAEAAGDRHAALRSFDAATAGLAATDEALAAASPEARARLSTQRVKADVFQAILSGCPELAVTAMRSLVEAGWSVYRSALPVGMVLCEPRRGANQALPSRLRAPAEAAAEEGKALTEPTRFDAFRRAHYDSQKPRIRRQRAQVSGSTS
jgi:hypothetical protein